ncbi:MAG TPA: hypothetical protein VGP63_24960 [Planctomycetaceae bacterium]|jgi:hypothetical protein|nr:hypothetical protein [Planctomycetaceae bacterium]
MTWSSSIFLPADLFHTPVYNLGDREQSSAFGIAAPRGSLIVSGTTLGRRATARAIALFDAPNGSVC